MQRQNTQPRQAELVDLDSKHDVKGGFQIELEKVRLTSQSFSATSGSSSINSDPGFGITRAG